MFEAYSLWGGDCFLVLLDHHLEVDVHLDPLGLIQELSLVLLFSNVIDLLPALFSVLLEPLDLFQAGGSLSEHLVVGAIFEGLVVVLVVREVVIVRGATVDVVIVVVDLILSRGSILVHLLIWLLHVAGGGASIGLIEIDRHALDGNSVVLFEALLSLHGGSEGRQFFLLQLINDLIDVH